MQNNGSVVSWKALWFGLIAGFISSAVGLVILIKTQKSSSYSLFSLGSDDIKFKELMIVWVFVLVVGFIAGLIVAYLNKRGGVNDGLMTGLFVMCINLISLLYYSVVMLLLMFFTVGSDIMFATGGSLWSEMFKMIGNALLVTFPYIIGGLLGGLLSNVFTGGGADMSMISGDSDFPGGFARSSATVLNDSLPPIVAEKNKVESENIKQQSAVANTSAQSSAQPTPTPSAIQPNNDISDK